MSATAYDRLLVALEAAGSRVARNGSGSTANCPGPTHANGDRDPSLSLRPIEGQTLAYCHTGCRTEDVLGALGLGMGDLYDEPTGATYRYDGGRVVHRSPGKAFRQSGDTKGRPQLYRLPAVVAAVQSGATVYVVEGEKDVHAIESLGAVATTSPMGAANWHKVDASPLAGAHVVVVPDRDDAGTRYAAHVVASLTGSAASLSVVSPKVGKDAADHVAAGYSLEDLEPVDLDAHRTGARTVSLSTVTPEAVSWVWPGRLPAGKLVVLDGDPSVGKSTLTVDWAARVSTGSPWPDGASCGRGDVLVLSAEDGLADTIRPRLDAAHGDPARVHALTGLRFLDDDGHLRERSITLADAEPIAAAIRRHSARLVVVDVLMAYLPGKVDSHKDQDIRTVLARLAAVAEATGCCVLLLRHLNKTAGGNPLYRGGGSIGIVGAARAGFVAAVDPDDETRRVLACTKSNLAPVPASLAYQLVSADNGVARVDWRGETTATAGTLLAAGGSDEERTERDEAVDWLLDHLEEHGGAAKAADVIRAAARDGIAKTTLHRARQRAGIATEKSGLHGGWVWRIGAGRFHEGSEGSSPPGVDSSEPSVDSSESLAAPPPCTLCGNALLLQRPGRDTCERCTPTLGADNPPASPALAAS